MNKTFITEEITSAMRAQDKVRLAILRLVKNEIDIKEKDSRRELTDEEVVAAFKKVLKQTSETLQGSIQAGTDQERTDRLQGQVDILTAYLPRQIEGDELQTIVDHVVAEHGIAEKHDMGKAIGLVVAEAGGNVDKAEVARLVGAKLG